MSYAGNTLQSRPGVNCRADRTVSVPTCSLKQKICEVAQKTAAAVTATAMFAGAANAGLTYDQFNSLTYSQVKGTGLANTCPIIDGGSDNPKDLKAGSYSMYKFCMEPSSFQVKEESMERNKGSFFTKTKLLTRLTYSLDEMEGKFIVGSDGKVKIVEEEGLDFSAVTVQMPGGERVPFLFTVKQLDAAGPIDGEIKGDFLVPSYRGSTFLDPKGRGGSTGYLSSVGVYADQDNEEFANKKVFESSSGKATFTIAKVDPATGEVAGVFETVAPSDTDLGAKDPRDVKTTGIWYARLQ